MCVAELEKKLAELQKYVKRGGENPPEWLSLESEEAKTPKVRLFLGLNLIMLLCYKRSGTWDF